MIEHGGLVRILPFDLDDFEFPTAVADLLGRSPLSEVHLAQDGAAEARSDSDQDTAIHQMFYTGFEKIRPLYERFVREVIAPLHREDLCVQVVPTFRVHCPGGVAVREFHRDSDYRHQPGIINYWLPLTRAFDTNSIWIETAPDSGQFTAAELNPGQILQFDAIRLRHGNHSNATGVTRVSFDFRVVPWRVYQDSQLESVVSGRRLALGDYYAYLPWEGR